MSKDQHTHLGQIFIAAHMIDMNMGVHQKPNFLIGHLLHRCNQLIRKRSKQGVHQKHTIWTHLNADVAAATRALDHVDVAGDGSNGEFHTGEIALAISEAASNG